MKGRALAHLLTAERPIDRGRNAFGVRGGAGNDLGHTQRLGAGGDARLIAAPRDEHHRLSVPQRLHHRSVSGVANQQRGTLQHGRMGNRPLDAHVPRMSGELGWVVFRSNGDEYADWPISECLDGGLRQLDVVLPLGADRHQDPWIAGLVQKRRTRQWRFPDAEWSDVVVPRRQCGKGVIEDLVGRVQNEIRRLQQLGVAADQRQGPRANVLFDRTRWVGTDVEGAVHRRPRNGWAGGVHRLDAKERGHDGCGSMAVDQPGDRLRHLVGPDSQAALHERTRLGQIATGHLHRVLDHAGHPRPEVELLWENVNVNAERTEQALYWRITDEDGVVPPIAEGQARGCQRR